MLFFCRHAITLIAFRQCAYLPSAQSLRHCISLYLFWQNFTESPILPPPFGTASGCVMPWQGPQQSCFPVQC